MSYHQDYSELYAKPRPPRFLAWRSSSLFIVVACAAVFADVFVYGLIVPALPMLLPALIHIDPGEVQTWITILLSVYGVANAVTSPAFGYLADLGNTRRNTFMASLLAMTASIVAFALSTSKVLLILSRVLQGIAAAGVWTVSLAIVVDTVQQDHIGAAMGYVSLAMTSGNVLGPMCGGIIFDHGGLLAITVVALSFVAIPIVGRIVMVEVQSARKWEEATPIADDISGTRRYGTFHHGSIIAEDDDSSCNEASDSSGGQLAASTAAWSSLATRRFLVILGGICVSSAFYSAFDTILPLQTVHAFHWDSTGSGLIFLPLSLPTLLSPLLGRAVDKFGTRIVALTGFIAGLPCYVALSFVRSNTIGHKTLMCFSLFGMGLCLIAQMIPLMTEVSKVVDRKGDNEGEGSGNGTVATGYALFNAAYASGIVLGAFLGGLATEELGWRVTTLLLGAVSLTAAIPLWLTPDLGMSPDDIQKAKTINTAESEADSIHT